jgi:hypothetical protein
MNLAVFGVSMQPTDSGFLAVSPLRFGLGKDHL